MKKNKNFLKYIICSIFLVLIFNIKGLDIKAAETGFKFSCDYNNFTFKDDGNKYKVRVEVYENDIKFYKINGNKKTEIKNGDFLSSAGIDEVGNYYFSYQNKTSAFYSNGKNHCPTLDIDRSSMNNLSNVYIFFDADPDITDILSNRPTSGPTNSEGKSDENAEKVVLDCSNGSNSYKYYYKQGDYSNGGGNGIVFKKQLSFNFKKYNTGKIEVSVKSGNNNPVTKTYDDGLSPSFTVEGYNISFKDLGNFDKCPEFSELYFCWSGDNTKYYITTKKSDNCLFEEQASQITDEKTANEAAKEYGVKYPSGIGGGTIDCDNLSEKLIDFLKNAFIIVKVVAILIAIAMSILDLMGTITKDKDLLSATIKKIIRRIILVIVVLLLPTLINIIGRLIAGKDILCGIV